MELIQKQLREIKEEIPLKHLFYLDEDVNIPDSKVL